MKTKLLILFLLLEGCTDYMEGDLIVTSITKSTGSEYNYFYGLEDSHKGRYKDLCPGHYYLSSNKLYQIGDTLK